jgi:probable HAF family extracellular repeat protein
LLAHRWHPASIKGAIKMRLEKLSSIVVLAFLATSAAAQTQVRYRITPIPAPSDGQLDVTGMNNRGEVIGWTTSESLPEQRGFVWRDGGFVYLNDRLGPNITHMEPLGINDRSQVVGYFTDPTSQTFRGFLLDRNSVRYIDGPPGAQVVFVNEINDRELILGSSYDAGGVESWWLLDEGQYTVFDSSFNPAGYNLRGVVSGRQFVSGSGVHAALWDEGQISVIAPAFSSASDINERGQVVGVMNTNVASRAFLWERGRLTQLPALRTDQTSSFAGTINNAGVIAGSTTVNQPTGTVSIATLWYDGRVVDLNTLIHPDDPLRPYVTLESASINDRGEILASGHDSRSPSVAYFFLEPTRR